MTTKQDEEFLARVKAVDAYPLWLAHRERRIVGDLDHHHFVGPIPVEQFPTTVCPHRLTPPTVDL